MLDPMDTCRILHLTNETIHCIQAHMKHLFFKMTSNLDIDKVSTIPKNSYLIDYALITVE